MPHIVWKSYTPLNPTNMNKLLQWDDILPGDILFAADTFNGQDGRTLTHNFGHTNYQVTINPTADPAGFLGEIWVNKSANTAVVYNSGSHAGAFDYQIISGLS